MMITTCVQQLRSSAHKATTVPLRSSIEDDQQCDAKIETSKSGATLEIADSKQRILAQN